MFPYPETPGIARTAPDCDPRAFYGSDFETGRIIWPSLPSGVKAWARSGSDAIIGSGMDPPVAFTGAT